ncbi:PAS domain-containing sensor histidine kinase [Kovacikia minuta CCNUW1]|uniref:sensor histidine kinase n=1 Tax=Kovacikia minuta TaxID=2931930 RepID=UPI001CCB946E|nr:PAS domain-containing sensor histidine kinase [Kovacikia minuta]UBF26985.1 PAS domain-containing sensor histidine kinase [Kovacikia minuta CCNUW1]
MQFLWFLLGLVVGLGLLGWHQVQLNLKLRKIIQILKPDALKWSLSSTARLTRAIAAFEQDYDALVREVEDWRRICQISPTGFLWVDEENQLIRFNPQALKLLGIQNPPSQPRLLLELVRSFELDQLIEETRRTAKPCQRDWTFHPVTPDPSVLSQQISQPLRAYGFPLQHRSVGVFLENRQEAVSLAQQRDRWTSDVAHELKTPLTSIRLVVETLQSRLEPPLSGWADRLLQETIRLSSLVQDLLDLSQLESYPTPLLTLKVVDLVQLIQSAWLSLEPLAKRKQLRLECSGLNQLLIRADESRLHRVLINLLDNSIKYSPQQAKIQIQVKLIFPTDAARNIESTQQVYLAIIDSGPGFLESAIPYVFERFYRSDPSRSRSNLESGTGYPLAPSSFKDKRFSNIPSGSPQQTILTNSGSGLGLAIVRQIVEAHGGSVKASNHPETQGAWVQVFLPYEGE